MAVCLLTLSSTSRAFDQLTPAQSLIYDTAHLANTTLGQTIQYHYEASEDSDTAVLIDEVRMTISGSEKPGRRDIEMTFLSDERNLPLPTFTGYRGNPVIIAMLEHVAQSLGEATGGGTLYFRNRIRDALAEEDLEVNTGKTQFEGNEITTQTISFTPFINDKIMAENSPYREAEFSISFSNQIPAGVLNIRMRAGSGNQRIDRTLQLKGAP